MSLTFHLINMVQGSEDEISDYMCQHIYWLAMDIVSLLIHKKYLRHLYSEAKEGNDKSLFKVIQIDKSAIDSEWVRDRIRKAMYEGDNIFFTELSKAIKKDPLQNRKLKIELHLVLMFFWPYGLYRLTVPEIMELLEDSGFRLKEDEVTFRKFIDREVSPFFKFKV